MLAGKQNDKDMWEDRLTGSHTMKLAAAIRGCTTYLILNFYPKELKTSVHMKTHTQGWRSSSVVKGVPRIAQPWLEIPSTPPTEGVEGEDLKRIAG